MESKVIQHPASEPVLQEFHGYLRSDLFSLMIHDLKTNFPIGQVSVEDFNIDYSCSDFSCDQIEREAMFEIKKEEIMLFVDIACRVNMMGSTGDGYYSPCEPVTEQHFGIEDYTIHLHGEEVQLDSEQASLLKSSLEEICLP